MKLRTLLPVVAALAVYGLISASSGRRRRHVEAEPKTGEAGVARSFEAAPLVVVSAERAALRLGASQSGRVEVRAGGGVEVTRSEDGAELLFEVARGALEVLVPRGSALRLELARSAANGKGLDDIELNCARSSVSLRDVAGTLTVNSARGAVEVALAHDRRTESLDLDAARSALTVILPPDRGATYDVQEARSSVTHPAPVEGGIPIAVSAARASVAIRRS